MPDRGLRMWLPTTRRPTGTIYLRDEKENVRGEATARSLTVLPLLSVDVDLGANIGLQDALTAYCELAYHPSVGSVDTLRAARNDDNLRTTGPYIDYDIQPEDSAR